MNQTSKDEEEYYFDSIGFCKDHASYSRLANKNKVKAEWMKQQEAAERSREMKEEIDDVWGKKTKI